MKVLVAVLVTRQWLLWSLIVSPPKLYVGRWWWSFNGGGGFAIVEDRNKMRIEGRQS